jgi:predicted lipoprotein with Yx(FWY)xxD motif
VTKILALTLVATALLIAGCGDDDDDGSAESGSAETTATAESTGPAEGSSGGQPAATGTTIKLGGSQYGRVLFGPDDGAIYYFDKESGSRSECYGACAQAWPPVLTDGEPKAGSGVRQSLLGTTKRDDGTSQVTYAGHPLYYYVDDPPGEVLCHNVEEFGGLWLAVQPSGDPVA